MAKNKITAILNLTEDNEALKPLTNNRPIAGLPFASRYRIIDFALSSLAHAEVDSVGIFIGDSGRAIYDHIRSGEAWDLNSRIQGGVFTFSQQHWKANHHLENLAEDFYYNQYIFLKRSRADYAFVSGSKIIANVDIKALRAHHIESKKDITIIYKHVLEEKLGPSHPNERILEFNDRHEIIDLHDNKDHPQGEIQPSSLDMFLVSVPFLMDLIDRARSEKIYMELDELLQYYLLDYSVNPYEYTGYAANIYSVQAYYQANMDMLNRQYFMALFHTSQPVLTKTKNGVPTFYHARSFARNAIIATGTSVYGEVIASLVNRRVLVGENASVRNSILLQGCQIGEGARVEYAILDKNVVIEPGAHVIGSPNQIKVIGKNEIVRA